MLRRVLGFTRRHAAAPGQLPTVGPRLEPIAQFRPFALVAPEFVQVDLHPPQATVDGVARAPETPVAPFAAVELDVSRLDGATVVAGLSAGPAEQVLATYDAAHGLATIEVQTAGQTTAVRRKAVELAVPFRFGFAVCENQVTALADTGSGCQPLMTSRREIAALVDLRDQDQLGRFAYAYGARGGPAGITRVRAGYFGMAGLRDPHLVQYPDGQPYSPDGRLYLTFTCAGLGFFRQAHWGVFALDPADPTTLEQVAQLYFRRNGQVLGDHAGQLVWDPADARFVVVASSWGDFDFNGVHVRHLSTQADLLRGVHVLDSRPLSLPTTMNAWDPALSRIDGRWYVGFVQGPSLKPFDFHPALAAGERGAAYDAAMRLVGADESRHQCEGTLLSRIGDRWLLLASDKDAQRYLAYDLTMRLVGALDAPYPTNIPHPQLVRIPGAGGGRRGEDGYLMVTFDGTPYGEDVLGYGGHGDVIVMSSRR